MFRLISIMLCFALIAGCQTLPRRGKAVPVDYHDGRTLYQATCQVDADLRGLPGESRPATDDCAYLAMNTCKSAYHIVHKSYGDAHWRLLNSHDILVRPIPRRLRAQDKTIEFICQPMPASGVPITQTPPVESSESGEYYTK